MLRVVKSLIPRGYQLVVLYVLITGNKVCRVPKVYLIRVGLGSFFGSRVVFILVPVPAAHGVDESPPSPPRTCEFVHLSIIAVDQESHEVEYSIISSVTVGELLAMNLAD